jgi:dienelactone hydrolase
MSVASSLLTMLAFAAAPPPDLATELRQLARPAIKHERVINHDVVRRRLLRHGVNETETWNTIKDRAGWEKYRNERINALRRSLGTFPTPPRDLQVRIRKTLIGTGYAIDCLTFQSRPSLTVTANLYRPTKPGKAMPGLLLVHSHHNPKTEGELQDMGILWARAGCLVLVMDLLGHGERRQHPFRSKEDYSATYRPNRQDYYFRYNVAMQLQTVGDSLMGWLVWDLMRGVDLLLSREGIDPNKIAILGSVAGGGDPAAVTAALDRRISAAVIFNFGGPQPETTYPLPDNAERSFLYSGSGSWESTRNLYRSAKDGFLPWVIVGAIAPRRHVYAHEFSWDDNRDPVWNRLRKIHAWYETPDHLASARGTGLLRGRPPEASHCNNIGAVHRRGVHEAFKRWFGIAATEPTRPERWKAEDLLCLHKEDKQDPLYLLIRTLGAERSAAARARREKLEGTKRQEALKKDWSRILGDVEPGTLDVMRIKPGQCLSGVKLQNVVIEQHPKLPHGIAMHWLILGPGRSHGALVLMPPARGKNRRPVVVGIAQGGTISFLQQRTDEIVCLLREGNIVALPQFSDPGWLPVGAARGRTSLATSLASSHLMLGETVLGEHLRALRRIVRIIRTWEEVDPARISLWGDSFAAVNPPGTRLDRPLDVPQPALAEPMGANLALLCALFEPTIESVRVRGGFVQYQSILESPFMHVPFDTVVPGILHTGDLPDVVTALAPRPVRLDGVVNARNQLVPAREIERIYAPARAAYKVAGADRNLILTGAR